MQDPHIFKVADALSRNPLQHVADNSGGELKTLVQLAAHVCDAPFAFIASVVGEDATVTASFGLSEGMISADAPSLRDLVSISPQNILVVADATLEPSLAGCPLVRGKLQARFLALAPVQNESSMPAGVLCVFDRISRKLTASQEVALGLIAGQVEAMMELSRRRSSDDRLRLIATSVAHLNDLVIITEAEPIDDPGPRIVYVNEAFTRRTGYSAQEVVHRNPRFLQGPKTQREALDRVRQAMADQVVVRVEIINYTKSGEEFWLEMEVVPVFGPGNRCTHFIAIERDITERKNAGEKQCEAAEEILRTLTLLRAVAASTPDAVFVKDLKGRYLLFNEGAARVVGKPTSEVLGNDDSAVFGAEDAHLIRQNDLEVIKSGQTRTTVEVLTVEGVTRIFLATKSPYRDGSGNIIGMVGISRDITERHQAAEKLREQGTLLDQARDAILVCDLKHCIQYWNRGAERMYGWTEGEAQGKSFRELLCGDPASYEKAAEQTLHTDGWTGALKFFHKSGRVLDVECHWSLVRDDAGLPKSILAINTDVTERKKLEQLVLRAQRMESIGTLAGGIAHDLNNVLAPISMSIELLKMDESSESKLDLLELIERSAMRGSHMVKQVLSFARGVDGQSVTVQVRSVVREIQRIVCDTFPKNIQTKVLLPEDLWPVLGDSTQLHQVLLNLCVNARDAMPHGGALTISASNVTLDGLDTLAGPKAKPGPYLALQVEDSGTGMPPEVVDRIFEPFYTTKETGKGTGLGLSTTVAIVNSHGGHLKVYSEVGVGTKFTCYLPAQVEAGGREQLTAVETLPRGRGELVLVVDDEAPVREITRQTLESFGYRVLLAADGAEALAVYAENKKDVALVLTDMMMPVMDGPAMIQVLAGMSPQLRILATSGLSGNGLQSVAGGSSTILFLPKPYTASTLLQTLHQMLRSGEDALLEPRAC